MSVAGASKWAGKARGLGLVAGIVAGGYDIWQGISKIYDGDILIGSVTMIGGGHRCGSCISNVLWLGCFLASFYSVGYLGASGRCSKS